MRKILIGSRKSPLAVIQTELIIKTLIKKLQDNNLNFEIITFETHGDKNLNAGIKTTFTYEIEQALLNHDIDLAVHSLKDLSLNVNPEIPVLAYSEREDPRDALICNSDWNIKKIIGTSSLRRKLQLKELYSKIMPDLEIKDIRGNVNTRLKKLYNDGNFSGIVLAAAGLKRLGLDKNITRMFSTDEIIPAPGQGILICQGRLDGDYKFLEAVNNFDSEICATAEREFAKTFGTGCNIPVGAYAEIHGDILKLTGFYDGVKASLSGNITQAVKIARELSEIVAHEKN